MITKVYINDALLFEAAGDLLVTKDVFKIAGFDKPLDKVSIKVVDDVVELRLEWNLDDRLTKEEADELRATGKKIPVIKKVRERAGIGLREAKDLVDAYWQDHNLTIPEP